PGRTPAQLPGRLWACSSHTRPRGRLPRQTPSRGQHRAGNTVRVELALLSHVFKMAIREWELGLVANPVRAIRWPSPGAGRDRRLTPEEQNSLLAACDTHSNPMLGWMVRVALATGMRAGEIQRLWRSDVNLGRRTATLRDT